MKKLTIFKLSHFLILHPKFWVPKITKSKKQTKTQYNRKQRLTATMVGVWGIVKLLHLIVVEQGHVPVRLHTQRQERRLVLRIRCRLCILFRIILFLWQDKASVVVPVPGSATGLEVETCLPESVSSEMGKRNFGAEWGGEEFIDVGVMGKDQFISGKHWIGV